MGVSFNSVHVEFLTDLIINEMGGGGVNIINEMGGGSNINEMGGVNSINEMGGVNIFV